jgi:hypothetical protein
MAFTARHRFLKKHNLPYYCKLSCKGIAQLSGHSEEELNKIYEERKASGLCEKDAMNAVYMFVNNVPVDSREVADGQTKSC